MEMNEAHPGRFNATAEFALSAGLLITIRIIKIFVPMIPYALGTGIVWLTSWA